MNNILRRLHYTSLSKPEYKQQLFSSPSIFTLQIILTDHPTLAAWQGRKCHPSSLSAAMAVGCPVWAKAIHGAGDSHLSRRLWKHMYPPLAPFASTSFTWVPMWSSYSLLVGICVPVNDPEPVHTKALKNRVITSPPNGPVLCCSLHGEPVRLRPVRATPCVNKQ